MDLLGKLLGAASTSGTASPAQWLVDWVRGGEPTAAGVPVDETRALTYSAFWFGVRLIAEAVASLPLIVYRRLPGGGKERSPNDPLYALLHDEPNPEMTSMVFRETLQAHVVTWGNAYAEIQRDGAGNPMYLWPLLPNTVAPERNGSGQLRYRLRQPGAADRFIAAADVLHVPGLGFDGLTGYSVVRMARQSIGLGLACERFGATFFGNGAKPSGILAHPGNPPKPARDEFRDGWTKGHSGENANKTGILWGGWTYTNIGIPPEDAQFLESRAFQREEVGLWLNIPPFKLGVSKAATYASVEQFALDFVTHTIRPWLVRWEGEYLRKLVAPELRREVVVEHLVDGLLRGDVASRTAALQMQFLNGAISQDEWREIENRNPIPGGYGQTYYRPLNLAPVDAPPTMDQAGDPPPADTPAPADKMGNPMPADASGPVREAARAVLIDAAARMVRRECESLRRAAGKPAKFLDAVEEIYERHAAVLADAIGPACELWAAVRGVDVLPAGPVAERHCDNSRRALLDLAGRCKPTDLAAEVDRLCQRWETERPAQLAAWVEHDEEADQC